MNTLEMMNEAAKTGLTYWCSPKSGTVYNRDTGFTSLKYGTPSMMPTILNEYMSINTWEPVPLDPYSFKTGDPVWVWDGGEEKRAAWFACYLPKNEEYPFLVFWCDGVPVFQFDADDTQCYENCIPRVVE